ncbi:hypothetical protein AUJ84_04085 [Candidatus Pacearchaeota archaeon CG1_02_32_132]|nr:MAG: hypothetical protein AUJ84_04085 [Candidatus Pacearchaeota archaeon CG1_02_32_132]
MIKASYNCFGLSDFLSILVVNQLFKWLELDKTMYFDGHVHDRDWEEAYKETVEHVLNVARDSGVDGIGIMPNTKPSIFTEELAVARYNLAKAANIPEVAYFIWMGVTKDPEQIKRGIQAYRRLPFVLGFKMYGGNSTNQLGIVDVRDHFNVFNTFSNEGYDGSLLIHPEKEARMKPEIWDPRNPITHAFARPAIAETESIRDMLGFAYLTGFKGKLHFVHVSTHEGVEYINLAKKRGLDVSAGVCPHHLLLPYTEMLGIQGLEKKMNPPLRAPGEPELLLEDLREGRIDFLETDHAPHTRKDKYEACASGVNALAWWPLFEEFFRRRGFTEKRIEEITFSAAVERFGADVIRKRKPIKDRRGDYEINPWRKLEEELGMVNKL